ncbi:hypothetical protein LCM17_10640 [Cereibacter sphaeroides]|nr:hypothetical protein [Cereibacter sphaeroides]
MGEFDHVTALGARFELARDWGSVLVMDSGSPLTEADRGCFLIAGSHGSAMAARLTLPFTPCAAIFHDAGIGKNDCGVAGLLVYEAFGIPACTTDAATARIGDGQDAVQNGRISRLNRLAGAAGVTPGMSILDAIDRMARHVTGATDRAPVTRIATLHGQPIWLADTVSFLDAAHAAGVAIVASHGAAVTGAHLLGIGSRAALANDAGGGREDAGRLGLRRLGEAGIPAASYSHLSAEIGNAHDAWEHGLLSWVNDPARTLGLTEGQTVQQAAACLARHLETHDV